ncbi:MAG: peptidylprolyl isomerase [Myxococcota bacterium]
MSRIGLILALPLLINCASREPDDSAARERRRGAGSESANAESADEESVPTPARAEAPPAPPTPPPPPDPEVAPAAERHPALLNPTLANETAPANYAVRLETTKGEVIIDVTRAWSPNGADRFYNLVRIGAFTDVAFFRVIPGFMAQVGLNGDPAVNTAWRGASIQDDPAAGQSNTRGMVTFAKTGAPNSRTQQFFINFSNNARLDSMGFTPFGRVRDMTPVDALHGGYGEGAPRGRGPAQGRIQSEGNAYLRRDFPQLDYIRRATIVES